ncbi:MAG: hypothetical protein L0Z54_06620, partial [Thermoplasmata archaeon]|nr:hypothetical protein [Thermoplasmata archaeon]
SRLAVANGGEEAVTITLTVRGDISRWGSLSPSSVTLRAGTNDTATLTVSAPGSATVGDHPLTVVASTREDGIVAWLNATVRVVEGASGEGGDDDGGLPGFGPPMLALALAMVVAFRRRRP